MLSMALTFLLVGLVAGLLGLWGVAQVATHIAWVLFLMVLAVTLIWTVLDGLDPIWRSELHLRPAQRLATRDDPSLHAVVADHLERAGRHDD